MINPATERTMLRLLLSSMDDDAGSSDAVTRILSEIDIDGARDVITTLLAVLIRQIGGGREAWEAHIQRQLVGPLEALPEHLPDFKRER